MTTSSLSLDTFIWSLFLRKRVCLWKLPAPCLFVRHQILFLQSCSKHNNSGNTVVMFQYSLQCTYLVTWVAPIDFHTTLQPSVCCRKKWKSTKFTHLTVLPSCAYSHVLWTIFNCEYVHADPAPERYWELLAEERRLALQEALEENERVSFFVPWCFYFNNRKVVGLCCMNLKDLSCVCFDQLYKEMEELKERNKTLQEIAGQAEYFASLYQVHAVIMQKSVLAD